MSNLIEVDKTICKIVFSISIGFIAVFVFTYTLGQILPIEIVGVNNHQNFYGVLVFGMPVAVMLTLFGTNNLNSG